MPVQAEMFAVVLDCADPAALSKFYQSITGWEVTYSDESYVYLGNGTPVNIGFQKVAGYQPPAWPDPAKHAHTDFKVPDMEVAAAEFVALGATRPEHQPGDGKWIVLLDPEGHAFCITT